VVFHDNMSGAVRFVQWRGRTGRKALGRVVTFLVSGTRDEAYFWLARRKLNEEKRVVDAFRAGRESQALDTYLQRGE